MARNACDYNFYQTGGQVTPYREGILTPFRFSVSENEVRKAMESRNDDEPHQLLDRLLKKLQFTSVSDCKSTCIDFLYQVVSYLRNSGRSIPHHLETVDKMAAYIGRMESFQALSQEMQDSLDTLYQLSIKDLDTYRSVVYKMKV